MSSNIESEKEMNLNCNQEFDIKFINKKLDFVNYHFEYYECVEGLINSEVVLKMKDFIHHGNTSCFEHCINVSYANYKVCKVLKLDYKSAARAGILHDLFLYDWHEGEPKKMFEKHGFTHSKIALKNAKKHFYLNKKEQDMILKHMWPLNITLPQYKESYMISFADKFCCILEVINGLNYKNKIRSLKNSILNIF